MATCKNGHYFPDDQAECPYCPRGGATAASPTSAASMRTVIGVPEGLKPVEEPTAPIAPVSGTLPVADSSALKTQIGTGASTESQPSAAPDRKLTGWLVTFDRQPMGQDFRLREGRNTIGTAPDCEVHISGDANVSGKHVTILFRLGEVLFRDELSTNGTFINEQLTNEGALNDGDSIRVGNTSFLFRSATAPNA